MRYAIYFAPAPGSLLHALGSQWLGRDAMSGESLVPPALDGIADLTAEPRRYGFHATLKPPFALRDGCTEKELTAATSALAARLTPVQITLALRQIDGFLALVPAGPASHLDALAAACVRDLDSFRRPPDEAELARRRKAQLTERQGEHLLRWGYPYVFDEFRFHMTLTRRLKDDECSRVVQAAERHFAEVIGQVLAIDCIWLFTEPFPGAPFSGLTSFPFSTSLHEATP